MNKFGSIFMGLILLALAIIAWGFNYAGFGNAALEFLKGGLVWVVLMVGLVLVILGLVDLKG